MKVLLIASFAAIPWSCSRPPPPPPETSANWQSAQISLTGEWYPSVALSGAADSLEDYLTRIDLSAVPPKSLTLYLDYVLSEQILPQHRDAYNAALDAILARAQKVCSASGITVKRGSGGGAVIQHGPNAEPKLIVQTHIYDNGGISITITNMAHDPFSRVHYGKGFRGASHFRDEQPLP